jgi:CDP-diacylglycerol--glycerol-3-phosphate 3-phosphatidyltransferase
MATRAVQAPLAYLPNALTLGRLALIPVFVAFMVQAGDAHTWPAGIVWLIAGITDQIDGFLARRWHVESAFGRIADPLADRLLIDLTVILLWHVDRLPWIALLIPARDLLLMLATPLALGRGYRFEVNLLGKIATWVLYASLGFLMLTASSADWPLVLFWIGLGIAFLSAALYARKARVEIAA